MIPPNGERMTGRRDDVEWLIDRLVDGEMDGEARRRLLLRLEAEPGGWRRCALAFLEAQCWREALAGVADRPAAHRGGAPELARRPGLMPASSRTGGPGVAAARRRSRLAAWLGRAAALALVFGLGWAVRGTVEPPPTAPLVATAPPADPPRPAPAPQVMPVAVKADPGRPRAVPRAASVSVPSAPDTPVPLLSNAVLSRLERRGYQVEQRHAMAAVTLDDGRRVAIPIEEVKFRFVGARTY
jgi:hypothetical protein